MSDDTSRMNSYVAKGEEFDRDTNYIEDRILADPDSQWPVEPGRYRLIAARACPWANRTIIVRRLLGLEDVISIGMPGPTHDTRSWTFDLDPGGVDPVLGIERLQQAFFARFPDYPRGITVPAMVEIASGAVVTNDFPQITEDFSTQWKQYHREGAPDLWPEESREEMEKVMRLIYTEINNGVYRCGFAGSQEAYDAAFDRLFAALDTIEQRLSNSRYLMGGSITEADVRLFTTLVRFDPVYFGHFKCNRQTLRDFENLWGYARDLYQTPGFGDTVDFTQIKQHYYIVHVDVNPTQIVPKGPDLAGWLSPHGRERLGGSPFGDGTAPGPVRAGEEVPKEHTAAAWL
ncbi:MAG: glutathione S-transferase family protein [Brevibacterium aurantiacum]|uniref:Glutathione-dependent reductase n=1 Tax=Brevibacterium aurantiacum TaxID=273384 RepID=A0A2A3YW35_BREAU|nr:MULTISPECIES: glutathione S-transferase C-terminal domain-containing protein [Brevibacterium]MDN5607241.1 glutathione S-transferase C-terminal domain-containing protein [Brevibacterium sp.]MDN6301169.1 glutathione S-transferase C-terminal domain-containing protein [Micrococcaceae bacterium]MCF2587940.1 glutathione S-transferase C-terminal domain-containing protein [Brevibacterium sp. UCMA 11752]PCC43483.1 glutathione-dependent reductase [Brevibacterium aurantiacum]PCC58226.1 glutathione-dep